MKKSFPYFKHYTTMRIYLMIVPVILFCQTISAQQDPMYTMYMFNTLSVNPAYAGSADRLTAVALHRSQWVNFKGAPTTQTFTVHAPLKKENISIGGSIVNDAHGPVKQTGFYLDASYRIFMGSRRLAFGLKAGTNLFSANLIDLNPYDENDNTFNTNIQSKMLPNFGFGAMYYSRRFYVGASIPKLLQNKLIDGEIPDFVNNKEKQHAFLIAGAVFDLSYYTKFKPTVLIKAVNGAPLGAEVTAQFLFYEKLWAGVMYRWQDAAGVLLQYEINNRFKIGYAYDYTLSDIRKYSDGSHEVMLGFDLIKGFPGDVSPRYF
ncbi:MAG: type IX secretion system membrane protein PorP/SprF [Flavobacteriales bacterium]|nr:type IX secretion system membrane protein PorP/SprF [Flavobacteriales bacterium]